MQSLSMFKPLALFWLDGHIFQRKTQQNISFLCLVRQKQRGEQEGGKESKEQGEKCVIFSFQREHHSVMHEPQYNILYEKGKKFFPQRNYSNLYKPNKRKCNKRFSRYMALSYANTLCIVSCTHVKHTSPNSLFLKKMQYIEMAENRVK